MNLTTRQLLRSWLRAERTGTTDQGERALRGVFRRLPMYPAPEGLVGRVLAELTTETRVALDPRWLRAAVLALGMLMSFALLRLPLLLDRLPDLLSAVVPATAQLIVAAASWLQTGARLWQGLAEIGETAGRVAASPPAITMLAALLATAVAGFASLLYLTHRHAQVSHPEPVPR